MKTLFILAFIYLGIHSAPIDEKVDFTVYVNGFTEDTGKAHVAIYRSTDKFPTVGSQYQGQIVSIDNKIAKVIFKDIPKGKYAVATFHDKNKNGYMDKNLVGYPTEKFGFSNNARSTFSAPSFESAAVSLEKDKTIWIYIK